MHIYNPNFSDIFIPATAADIYWALTEGNNSIYKNLPCPPVNIYYCNGYAYVYLHNIIEYAFLEPKHLPNPLLPTSPHSEAPCRMPLLYGYINNPAQAKNYSVFHIKIIL